MTNDGSGVVAEWRHVHGRNPDRVLPGGVFASHGPRGEEIDTPTDHRMLWYVRDQLLGADMKPYVREIFEFLNDYLAATCQHHWLEYEAEEGYCEAHRQCLWCNDVEWKSE
ncbi:hypothetical protein PBI_OVECHKIN_92 [Mycobacterium phage Ovechkin]|uniref:Uncharacterized protein n=1 Tax=Mycobacterium phage Ovechkin TaxID=1673889 RepID=A0A0H4TJF1_9CAUD|nr:hypothetical protein SEAGREEN_87 [Mycobacterium phage Seagreen]YP_009211256.1 hypothetical protein PBI_OVECHKIN_92 [Mycobacterium phage Ovechkin]AKQ06994.1 hypothetical protein PBI_OVECHKIN_92 [Mycobacterium phage Ovechkin]ALA48730.1 hypothetical protein SEAGREEN_87 [Mycobacterium phage Seagreen]